MTIIIAKIEPITQKAESENSNSIALKNTACSIPLDKKLVVFAAAPTIVAINTGTNCINITIAITVIGIIGAPQEYKASLKFKFFFPLKIFLQI